jgi:hypothetical protein
LGQGSQIFEKLCDFDTEPIKNALDIEIKLIEDEIEKSRVKSEEKMRDRLA